MQIQTAVTTETIIYCYFLETIQIYGVKIYDLSKRLVFENYNGLIKDLTTPHLRGESIMWPY